jgi:hypothetical protein
LIVNVLQAYDEYNPRTLDRVWLTHQSCLNEIIECYSDNNYKIPHLSKDRLRDAVGNLPASIDVSDAAEDVLEEEHLYHIWGYELDDDNLA